MDLGSSDAGIAQRMMPSPVICDLPLERLDDARTAFGFRAALALSAAMPRGKERVVRWLQRFTPLGRPLRLRTHRDAWLVTDPQNLETYVRLARVRDWDDHVMQCCIDLLQPEQSFFDVGGNAGYISIQVSAAFAGQLDVATFEPQPTLARAAAGSAALNRFDRIRVFQSMIGKPAAIERLFLTGSSVHASRIPRSKPTQTIETPVYSLEELVAAGICRPPDVIKIDVEGAELEVITSSPNLLRMHKPVVIFESDANTERFGYSRDDLLDALRRQGYRDFFHVLEDGRYVPFDTPMPSRDIAAVPPARRTERFDAKLVD